MSLGTALCTLTCSVAPGQPRPVAATCAVCSKHLQRVMPHPLKNRVFASFFAYVPSSVFLQLTPFIVLGPCFDSQERVGLFFKE